MVDPLSILGAGLGVTSLILQVVDECVKGYRYYVHAANMPEQCQHLQLRVQMEQQRFLNFATVAGLLSADGELSATLKVNRAILIAVLAEVRSVFDKYAATNGRYVNLSSSREVDWEDHSELGFDDAMELLRFPPSLKKQSTFPFLKHEKNRGAQRRRGNNLRKIVMEPKRLVWAIFDKDRFEEMIARLAELNSFLTGLLDGSKLDAIQEATSASYHEILQMKNDIKSLQDLVRAFGPESRSASNAKIPEHLPSPAALDESLQDERVRKYLRRLAELKIEYTKIGQMSENVKNSSSYIQSINTKLDLELFVFSGPLRDLIRQNCRTPASWKDKHVWIEWKQSPSTYGVPLPRSGEVEMRLKLLTELLCFEKPSGFRSPTCHGYVQVEDENDEPMFGLVFGIQDDALSHSFSIYTLYELFHEIPKPSLTARVSLARALAESIYHFHAINWLHKGIRSESILIAKPDGAQPDLSNPYISGFELSRPRIMDNMTEKPAFDPLRDLYRYPAAQSSCPYQQYQKSYDLYSLGIVMMEIAHWKRLEDVLELGSLQDLRPLALQGVRRRLLGDVDVPGDQQDRSSLKSTYLDALSAEVGEAYKDMVEICLRSDEIEPPTVGNESRGTIGIRLQRLMDSVVIKKLRQLEVALGND
ncbi:hypothetical protein CNMCM5793_003345 [Aspergillus hiratsukae]|uniref:Protein kinase domain-containing protein n=1 Tax=Aspergillus hiratsukae TaxID=1194566 RepID=A0A8H6PE17_9EURO|nr:hypothetical protein CNMCM5793_003345 [Aspergillus hiratsukae]